MLFFGCACCLLLVTEQISQPEMVPVYSTLFPFLLRSTSMLRGFMCPSRRCQTLALVVAVYTTPDPLSGETPFGFAEYSVGVALKRDIERADPLVSRVLLKRDDGAADGQVRFFLQYEPNSIPQFSSWGKDVSAESGYHQRAHVDWELGTVVVADGKRDDASPDAVEGVFSSCRDLSWRR